MKRNESNYNNYNGPNYRINSKLCKLVESYPCLYDTSLTIDERRESATAAWEQISEQMEEPVQSCRERWTNIHKAYERYLIRVATCPKPPKPYYLHNELQFLKNHVAPNFRCGGTIDNKSEDSCTYEIRLESSPSSVQDKTLKKNLIGNLDSETGHEPEPETEPRNNEQDSRSETSSPIEKRMRYIYEETPKVSRPPKKDADLEFLNSMLPEMKKMNSRQKILFKAKMFGVLEEVFNDCKDFPQNNDPVVSHSSVASSSSVTLGLLPARCYGRKSVTENSTVPAPIIEYSDAESQDRDIEIKQEKEELDD